MKRLLLLLLLLPALAAAQPVPDGNVVYMTGTADPTGSCIDGTEFYRTDNQTRFTCVNNAWVNYSAFGGVTFPLLGGDGCTAPPFSFTNAPTWGLCRGLAAQWVADSVVLQADDIETLAYGTYAQLFSTTADPGGMLFSTSNASALGSASWYMQHPGTGVLWSNVVFTTAEFTTGTGASTSLACTSDQATGQGDCTIIVDSTPSLQSTTAFLADRTTFTDPIYLPDGTIAAPSATFTNFTYSGMYANANNVFLSNNQGGGSIYSYVQVENNGGNLQRVKLNASGNLTGQMSLVASGSSSAAMQFDTIAGAVSSQFNLLPTNAWLNKPFQLRGSGPSPQTDGYIEWWLGVSDYTRITPETPSGTNVITAPADTGTMLLDTQVPSSSVLRYQDDFFGGENNDSIGELGWTSTNCTVSIQPGVANHPGILEALTTGGAGTRCAVWLAHGSTSVPPIIATDLEKFTFIFLFNDITDVVYTFGLMNDADTANITDGVYVEFDPGASANIVLVTESGDTRTANATATAGATATWYKFEAVRLSGGNWEMYLDGTLEFTHSTNLPTVGLVPSWRMVRGATDSDFDIDYWDLRTAELTR